jgi:hypothetical protein
MIYVPENDNEYFEWLDQNPEGFVLNVDRRRTSRQYPKLHRSSCKRINDRNRENYVGDEWMKFCSIKRSGLETWTSEQDRRELQFCTTCGTAVR